MSSTEVPTSATVDLGFEVVVIPVSNVDRAKDFYQRLGWLLHELTTPLPGRSGVELPT